MINKRNMIKKKLYIYILMDGDINGRKNKCSVKIYNIIVNNKSYWQICYDVHIK